MRWFLRLGCAALLALALSAPAHAANAAKEVEAFSQLMGYAAVCAEKAAVKETPGESKENKLLVEKYLTQYKSLGMQAAQSAAVGLQMGIAAARMDQGAQCARVLSELAPLARSYGFSGSYFVRLQQALGGAGAQAVPGAAAGAPAPRAGFYRCPDDDMSHPFIMLKANHTGTFQFDGAEEANPFDWELKGGKLLFHFQDSSLPAEQRNLAATVRDADHFVLDGATYARDADSSVTSYDYAEAGYAGDLTLIDRGNPDRVEVEISTVNREAAHTCDLTLTCRRKGAMLLCRDEANEDKDAITTIKELDNGALDVDTTMSYGEYCGNRGSFTGKYRPVR